MIFNNNNSGKQVKDISFLTLPNSASNYPSFNVSSPPVAILQVQSNHFHHAQQQQHIPIMYQAPLVNQQPINLLTPSIQGNIVDGLKQNQAWLQNQYTSPYVAQRPLNQQQQQQQFISLNPFQFQSSDRSSFPQKEPIYIQQQQFPNRIDDMTLRAEQLKHQLSHIAHHQIPVTSFSNSMDLNSALIRNHFVHIKAPATTTTTSPSLSSAPQSFLVQSHANRHSSSFTNVNRHQPQRELSPQTGATEYVDPSPANKKIKTTSVKKDKKKESNDYTRPRSSSPDNKAILHSNSALTGPYSPSSEPSASENQIIESSTDSIEKAQVYEFSERNPVKAVDSPASPANTNDDIIQGSMSGERRLSNQSLQSLNENPNAPRQAIKTKKTSSKYRGVYFNKSSSSWRARIWIGGMSENLGSFPTEEEAAMAFDKRAIEIRGPTASINFPHLAGDIIVTGVVQNETIDDNSTNVLKRLRDRDILVREETPSLGSAEEHDKAYNQEHGTP